VEDAILSLATGDDYRRLRAVPGDRIFDQNIKLRVIGLPDGIRRFRFGAVHEIERFAVHLLERLFGGYAVECGRIRQDLAIAEAQLRDYQARLGQPFAQASYLAELTSLRDQLKSGLSGAAPEPGAEPLPSVPELAARIKALKAAHSIDAAPERTARRRFDAEEPVTTRIRRQAEDMREASSKARTVRAAGL
jgi:hypothetical protein